MDTLDRYLVREFLVYFSIIWAILVVIFLAIDFFARYWDLGMSMQQVMQLYAYQAPSVFQQFLPVAALMTSLLILSTMSRQNEILALYLGGVSLWRLLSTFLAIVATLSTVLFLFFDSWVPYFEKRRVLLKQGIDPSSEEVLRYGNERFWYRSGSSIYHIGRLIPDRNTLEDINIYSLAANFQIQERTQAKLARYLNDRWVLEDGFSIVFPESRYPLSSMFRSREGAIPEKPGDFKTFRLEEPMMRLRDLRQYIDKNHTYGFDTTHSEVSYHERVALIFTPLIFVMFAVVLMTRAAKHQSVAKSIGLCFLIVFAYLLIFRIFLSLGRGGHIPAVMAGWLANGLFIIGVFVLMGRKA